MTSERSLNIRGRPYCVGVNISGYGKGRPCANEAKYEHSGKEYCAVHLAIAVKHPGKMEQLGKKRQEKMAMVKREKGGT